MGHSKLFKHYGAWTLHLDCTAAVLTEWTFGFCPGNSVPLWEDRISRIPCQILVNAGRQAWESLWPGRKFLQLISGTRCHDSCSRCRRRTRRIIWHSKMHIASVSGMKISVQEKDNPHLRDTFCCSAERNGTLRKLL